MKLKLGQVLYFVSKRGYATLIPQIDIRVVTQVLNDIKDGIKYGFDGYPAMEQPPVDNISFFMYTNRNKAIKKYKELVAEYIKMLKMECDMSVDSLISVADALIDRYE